MVTLSAASFGQIGIGVSVRIGPPALPVYAQPICPGPGYLWTPGYWGWNDDGGYYWVPGTWVMAPVGMLWTPGYWGWGGGFYAWHAGYWGPHVGFYGGINYGFGYGGVGFVGGEWRGGAFYYNRYVTNVSVTNVTHVYNRTAVINENHVAYNGGEGGVAARPTAQEEAAEHEQHTPRARRADSPRTIWPARIARTSPQKIMDAQRSRPPPKPAISAATPRSQPATRAASITLRPCRRKKRALARPPKRGRNPTRMTDSTRSARTETTPARAVRRPSPVPQTPLVQPPSRMHRSQARINPTLLRTSRAPRKESHKGK